MNLPILQNHDATRPIGKVTAQDGALLVEFMPEHAVTEQQFFAAFGHVGVRFLETDIRDGVSFILRALVLEVSLPPEGK